MNKDNKEVILDTLTNLNLIMKNDSNAILNAGDFRGDTNAAYITLLSKILALAE